MGQARNPPAQETTPCVVRALHAHFGRVTTACVSSPKRLKAPPHLGAPFALFEHHSRLITTIQKIGDNFPKTSMSLSNIPSVFSAPPGATCTESRTYAQPAAAVVQK